MSTESIKIPLLYYTILNTNFDSKTSTFNYSLTSKEGETLLCGKILYFGIVDDTRLCINLYGCDKTNRLSIRSYN